MEVMYVSNTFYKEVPAATFSRSVLICQVDGQLRWICVGCARVSASSMARAEKAG